MIMRTPDDDARMIVEEDKLVASDNQRRQAPATMHSDLPTVTEVSF